MPTTAQLEKIATRIKGLDNILNGGLPASKTTLVSGGPGCGKSILGLEFLYRNAASGKSAIYLTFEERAADVRLNALSLGWDLAPLEKSGKLFLLEAGVNPEAIISGDFNVKGLLAIIEGKSKAMGANLIVIDALDVLLRLFDDITRERNEIYALHNWLIEHKMTAVMTAKSSPGAESAKRYDFLEFMADCVIFLDQRVIEQVTTRRMRIIKYRGSNFGSNEYPFVIAENGINIIPLSTVGLQHKALGSRISSGHPLLDTMLDGGYRRNSSILVSGTSGTGKSTLSCTFAHAACERGEKVLYISLEESPEAIVNAMLSPGIDLRPALKANRLQFLTAMPESMGSEAHLVRIFKAIEEFKPEHVILETISACERMGSQQIAFDFIIRLVNFCKEREITTILANQTAGFQNVTEISGVGISSLIDAVIFLRYTESGGELNRLLLVMKSRGTKHSNQYREFKITDHGIDIADVYISEGGVLTGIARLEKEAKDAVDQRRKDTEIKLKELEVAQKRVVLDAQNAQMKANLETVEAELEKLRLEQSISREESNLRSKMRGESWDNFKSPAKKKTSGPKGGTK